METNTETTLDPHLDDTTTTVARAPLQTDGTTTTPEVKVTEDGNIVEVGGKKYYREEALHNERAQKQKYAETLQQLEPYMPDLEQLIANKSRSQRATVDRATRSVDSDYTEDELQGYAISRGYYDPQTNQPDLKRAQGELDILTAIADRRVHRGIRPLAQLTAQDRATANVQRVRGQTFVDGQPIAEDKYLLAVAEALPDELKADPQNANLIAVMAAGLQALDDRKTGRAARTRREPLFREGSGGSVSQPSGDSLDALGRAAARARGKSPDQWAKMQRSVGRSELTGTILDEV